MGDKGYWCLLTGQDSGGCLYSPQHSPRKPKLVHWLGNYYPPSSTQVPSALFTLPCTWPPLGESLSRWNYTCQHPKLALWLCSKEQSENQHLQWGCRKSTSSFLNTCLHSFQHTWVGSESFQTCFSDVPVLANYLNHAHHRQVHKIVPSSLFNIYIFPFILYQFLYILNLTV